MAKGAPIAKAVQVRRVVFVLYERGNQWDPVHGGQWEIFELKPRFQEGSGPRYRNSHAVVDTKTGYFKTSSNRERCREIVRLGNAYETCIQKLDGPEQWPENLMKQMRDIRAKLFKLGWHPHLIDKKANETFEE